MPDRLDPTVWRPEELILLACARPVDDPEATAALRALRAEEVDWTRLAELALTHQVTPLLVRSFEMLAGSNVPAEILEALRGHVAVHRDRACRLVREIFDLLDAFSARGLRVVPFKGPTLAERAYGDVHLRLVGDLDLLVPKLEIPGVCAELEARGYRDASEAKAGRPLSEAEHAWYRSYQCEYLFVHAGDSIAVEPHWAIAPRTLAVPLDTAGLLDRASPFPFQGRSVPGLATSDLVLVLCVHASKHEWTELRSVTDLAELLARERAIDWPALLARARAQGSLRMLLLGLALAERVAGARLAPDAAAALAAEPAAQRLAAEVIARLFREDYRAPSVFELSHFRRRMRERRRDRIAYVLRTLFTPSIEHVTMLPLPPGLRFLYYPLKLALDYVVLPVRRRL